MNDMTRADAIDPPYFWEDYRSTHLRAPKEQLLEVPSGFFDVPGPLVPAGFIRDKDGEPPVRVAARAHPLLAHGQRADPTPRHADVLPGRSAPRARSGVQQRAGRSRPQAAHLDALTGNRRRGLRARLPLRHRARRREID